MTVKLNCSRCGNTLDKQGRVVGIFGQAPGDVIEVEDAEGARMIERGIATKVEKEKK